MQSSPQVTSPPFRLQTLKVPEYSIWLKGKKTGEATLEIDLKFKPFYTQMICGVMTESGLRRGKVGIMKGFKFKTMPILEELNEIDASINNLYLKFSEKGGNHFGKVADEEQRLICQDLRGNLTKLNDLLTESSRRVSKSFIYSDRKQLFQIQISFLNLGLMLLQGRVLDFLGWIMIIIWLGITKRSLHQIYYKRVQLSLNWNQYIYICTYTDI